MTFLFLTATCAGVFFYLEADAKGVKPLKWSLAAFGSVAINLLIISVAMSLFSYSLGFGGNFFANRVFGFAALLFSLWPIPFLYKAFSNECNKVNRPANQPLKKDKETAGLREQGSTRPT